MVVEAREGRMFCTTADVPFGPEFSDDNQCEDFIRWVFKTYGNDPRSISEHVLTELHDYWILLRDRANDTTPRTPQL